MMIRCSFCVLILLLLYFNIYLDTLTQQKSQLLQSTWILKDTGGDAQPTQDRHGGSPVDDDSDDHNEDHGDEAAEDDAYDEGHGAGHAANVLARPVRRGGRHVGAQHVVLVVVALLAGLGRLVDRHHVPGHKVLLGRGHRVNILNYV